jgi:Bacterial SH3 domain
MKTRAALFVLVLALIASESFAQQAAVERNVILRSESSTSSQALEHLQVGVTLTLLDPVPKNGFYHVKTADGQEGWVWSRNVTVNGSPSHIAMSSLPAASGAADCDDSLWDHVYNPERLIVKQKCVAVTGTIVDATHGKRADGVRHEADGDTHGWLKVDPPFSNLLNAGNESDEGGNLVFEIVCKFNVSQADAKPACSSYRSTIQIPPVGSHIRIVGSYVQDTNHSRWMEIHPVSSIELVTSQR